MQSLVVDAITAAVQGSDMTTLASVSSRPLLPILLALSGAHLLNDLISSMIPAMYPLLKEAYQLDFAQVGLITLAFQVTSSLLQPLLGFVTDHKPWPYAMVAGMAATLSGLVGLASAGNYAMVLVSAAMIGLGSAVFHPEATRMARHAAAGQQGFAQGIFQIGGHAGYAIGPLLAAMIVVPRGQTSIAWVSVVALAAMVLMAWTGARYSEMRSSQVAADKSASGGSKRANPAARTRVVGDDHPDRSPAVKECVHGRVHLLLHVLPDRAVRRDGASLADHVVSLSRGRRVWRDRRGHGRRSVWSPPRDLDFNPGVAALRAYCCRMPTCSGPAYSAS